MTISQAHSTHTIKLLALAVLLSFSGVYTAVGQCTCPDLEGLPFKEALRIQIDKAEAVFSGSVVEGELVMKDSLIEYTIEVSEVWRNIDSSRVKVRTPVSNFRCRQDLYMGFEYIILTAPPQDGSDIQRATACSGRLPYFSSIGVQVRDSLNQYIEPHVYRSLW